ncbi:MAG: ATP-binding protein [Deltaproteobacteria bacterium]|nr:ATP-binding protein [Deltaproteobacteria bacterium]
MGRDAELAILHAALGAAAEGPRFVHVRGHAGVGKTTLAELLRLSAAAAGHRVAWLSGEHIAPNPRALLEQLALVGIDEPSQLGRQATADVLVVDSFDALDSLATWFFRELVPRAGRRLLVLLLGRRRLELPVRASLSVQPFLDELELANLTEAEVRELLHRAELPTNQHDQVLQLTDGLPLALSLVLERHRLGAPPTLGTPGLDALAPALIADVLDRCPSDHHRDALRALSLLRTSRISVLLAMLGRDPRPLTEWMASLSFVDEVDGELRMHSVVREVLLRDLALRDPDHQRALARRAADALLVGLPNQSPGAQRQSVIDALFTRRNIPTVRDLLGLTALDHSYLRRATRDEVVLIAGHVERHEGNTSRVAFERCAREQPEGLFLVLDADSRPIAVLFLVVLGRTSGDDRRGDPLLDALRDGVVPPPGEEVACFRWFFTFDGYHRFGPAMTAAMFSGPFVLAAVAPPIPKQVFVAVSDPERWEPLDHKMMVRPRPDLGRTTLEDRSYGFAQCILPPTDGELSSEVLVQHVGRGLVYGVGELDATDETQETVKMRLDRDAFAEAVKAALATLHRPHELRRNPLANASMAGPPFGSPSALALAVEVAVEALGESPSYRELADVLRVTYLAPATKQEAAAYDLGLPYGTYRHRLRKAVALLTQELWDRSDGLGRRAAASDVAVFAGSCDPPGP